MDLSRFVYSPSSIQNRSSTLLSSSTAQIIQSDISTNTFPINTSTQGFKKKRKIVDDPFSPSAGLQELYTTPGKPELPLNLIIVGHNPSQKSWSKGHYYANPSNRMWPLLRKAQLIPSHYRCDQDSLCPFYWKIGFTDLIIGISETDSSTFTNEFLYGQRLSLYQRLVHHCRRVQENLSTFREELYYPKIIAFSGIRQWKSLFPISSDQWKKNYTTSYGIQKIKPPDWPFELSNSIVFLLPTSSGAAPMSTPERENPYLQLGELVRSLDTSTTLNHSPDSSVTSLDDDHGVSMTPANDQIIDVEEFTNDTNHDNCNKLDTTSHDNVE